MAHYSFCRAEQTNFTLSTERSSTVAKSKQVQAQICEECQVVIEPGQASQESPTMHASCVPVVIATATKPLAEGSSEFRKLPGHLPDGTRKYTKWSKDCKFPFVHLSVGFISSRSQMDDNELRLREERIRYALTKIETQNLDYAAQYKEFSLYQPEIERLYKELLAVMAKRAIRTGVEWTSVKATATQHGYGAYQMPKKS
jgi:hypothetical protein